MRRGPKTFGTGDKMQWPRKGQIANITLALLEVTNPSKQRNHERPLSRRIGKSTRGVCESPQRFSAGDKTSHSPNLGIVAP